MNIQPQKQLSSGPLQKTAKEKLENVKLQNNLVGQISNSDLREQDMGKRDSRWHDGHHTLQPIKPTLFKGDSRKLLSGTRFP